MDSKAEQLIRDNLDKSNDDIRALIASTPPVAKPSNEKTTYVTYVSIGQIFNDDNIAALMADGLEAWTTAADLSQISPQLPNPTAIKLMHARLSGFPGVDLSVSKAPALLGLFATGIDPTHPPILTADQSNALLAIGYDVIEVPSVDEIAAYRDQLARIDTARALTEWADAGRSQMQIAIDTYRNGGELPTHDGLKGLFS